MTSIFGVDNQHTSCFERLFFWIQERIAITSWPVVINFISCFVLKFSWDMFVWLGMYKLTVQLTEFLQSANDACLRFSWCVEYYWNSQTVDLHAVSLLIFGLRSWGFHHHHFLACTFGSWRHIWRETKINFQRLYRDCTRIVQYFVFLLYKMNLILYNLDLQRRIQIMNA